MIRAHWVSAAVFVALLVSSCSGDGEATDAASTPPMPKSTVDVPRGVSLTPVGRKLGFGDTATVVFEANRGRGSVLELTVDRVARGSIGDFSAFVLDRTIRSSTPYYVRVSVRNVGESDVGGVPVPLYLVDETNTLRQASTFTTEFERCESKTLPRRFRPGDTFDTCLVYLAPDRGRLESITFRPNQKFDPITWTGEVAGAKNTRVRKKQA